MQKICYYQIMQDPAKISLKIRELGVGWQEAEGYHALTRVEYGRNQPAVFNPASGIPLKIFVNITTGEIKMFLAILFEAD